MICTNFPKTQLVLCIFNQETQGVCVATYGTSKDFPAFFSPQSGFTSPYQVNNPEEAASLIGISVFYINTLDNDSLFR